MGVRGRGKVDKVTITSMWATNAREACYTSLLGMEGEEGRTNILEHKYKLCPADKERDQRVDHDKGRE